MSMVSFLEQQRKQHKKFISAWHIYLDVILFDLVKNESDNTAWNFNLQHFDDVNSIILEFVDVIAI